MMFLLLALGLGLSLNAQAAPSQGQERGGGKQIELEFAEVGQLVAKAIGQSFKNGKADFQGFDLPAFLQAMDRTEIRAKPDLCSTKIDPNSGGTEERCLDAQYLPEQSKIEVSEKEWRKKTCMEQAALAVHEYGRASANENGNYRFSSRVRNSDEVQAACDGREGDKTERCQNDLWHLNDSLKGCVDRYQERKKKGHEFEARGAFLEELKLTLIDWGKSADEQCKPHGKRACLDTCFSVTTQYCWDYCSVID
jgi:hypothetical protein